MQEELFDKVQDKGILVSSNLRWIHSSIGCYLSLQYIMFRYIEYKMQREDEFRGSDCRISMSSKLYDRMEKFSMDYRFIKSKAGSNLYFKVECRRLVYVDGLTKEDKLIVDEKKELLERAP